MLGSVVVSLQSQRKGESYLTIWDKSMNPSKSTKVSSLSAASLVEWNGGLIVGDSVGGLHRFDASINRRGYSSNVIEGVSDVIQFDQPLLVSLKRIKLAAEPGDGSLIGSFLKLVLFSILIGFLFSLTLVKRDN